MYRQKFVLDTSAFTNAIDPSKKKVEIVKFLKDLINLVSEARIHLNASCYIPFPGVYDELMLSLKMRKCPEDIINDINIWFIKKTPNRYEVKIPAEIFYEYINDIRGRIDKGLRVAEEAVKEAIKKKHHPPVIKMLRERYRTSLREGIVDSKEDFDVLLLAKELEAGVVTADTGMKRWAEQLGLRYIPANSFSKLLREYLKQVKK